jgi:CRISPR/Cas system CSM-associated protein Csm3 (group 7 of RAMP superfamily)
VHEFARWEDGLVIPATSLKGMLRSVHEAVTNSRLGVISDTRWENVPAAYRPLSRPKEKPPGPRSTKLTPSVALLGVVGGKSDREDEGAHEAETAVGGTAEGVSDQKEAAIRRAGRVFIDDIPVNVRPSEQRIPPLPLTAGNYGPSPLDANQTARGRKFYRHGRPEKGHAISIEAIEGKFTGEIRFVNLTEAELDSLIYAISLESGTAHKLGHARPYGYGSILLSVSEFWVERPGEAGPARFERYDDFTAPGHLWSAEDRMKTIAKRCLNAGDAWRKRNWPDGYESYKAFAQIFELDAESPVKIFPKPPAPPPPPKADEAKTIRGTNIDPARLRRKEGKVALRNKDVLEIEVCTGPPNNLRCKYYKVTDESCPREVIDKLWERKRSGKRTQVVLETGERENERGKRENVALDIEIAPEGRG